MSIENNGRSFDVNCDFCSYGEVVYVNEFCEVTAYMRTEGWMSTCSSEGWMNRCPACVEKLNSTLRKGSKVRCGRSG
jgi:hypothetical protein